MKITHPLFPAGLALACLVGTGCGTTAPADEARASSGEVLKDVPDKERGGPSGRRTKIYTAEDRERARALAAQSHPKLEGPSPVRFTEQAIERGVDFEQYNGKSDQRYYTEIVGSGAIFFDAEGDGDADLYLLNQTNIEGPPPSPKAHSSFFLNDGTGHFTEATEGTGLLDRRYSVGVCGGDVDNDGDIDLYVTRFDAPHSLYRNDGGLKFTDVAQQAGVTGDDYAPSSCAFADIDNDGWIDLYFGNYVEHNRKINPPCWKKLKGVDKRVREYCGPGRFAAVPDRLYRNRGDGTFEDVSVSSGIAASKGKSLGVGFCDWDRDGDQDLYVACDRTPSLLFQNDGKGHFTEGAMAFGAGLSEDGKAEAGMGMTWGDFDQDGWFDLVKTNYEYENDNLYRNLEGKSFVDVAQQTGAGPPSYSYLKWGTDLFDADNDGDLDLFVANGHLRDVSDQYETTSGGLLEGYAQLNLFFLQHEPGEFISLAGAAGPGLEVRKVSRGAAWADIDRDGDLDLIVTNQHEHPDLLVNESPHPGHWLEVQARGTRSNRSGIGAELDLLADGRHHLRQVRSGQSYLSQSDLTVHFGIGEADRAESLTIRWPSGKTQIVRNPQIDRVLIVTEEP